MNDEISREISSSNNQDYSQNEEKNSLLKKVQHGSMWAVTSHAGSQIIRFVSNLILTRLLFAEAFGIMAIVNTFLVGLALFSDVGITPSIIQNKRGEETEYLNTAWTIQVGRGFILFFVALLGSIPCSLFYNEPMLAKLIPVASLDAIIQGFISTKLPSNNRNLNMKRLTIIELSSQVCGLIVMIIWALLNKSIWALVFGGLAASTTKTILSHTILPGQKNHFHWNWEDARSLFHFGRWIFISTILTFFAQQSDRLIFGKMIPLALLGIYHIGNTLGNIPLEVLRRLMTSVFFPLFSRINETAKDLRPIFIETRWIILVFAGWIFSGFIAGGTTIVELLYDDRYQQAGWIVQFISVGCWFSLSMASYTAILLSRAKTLLLAISNGIKFVGMIIFIYIGNKYFGFQGAVLGIAVSEFCRLLVISSASARVGLSAWHQDLILSVMIVVVSICGRFMDIYLVSHGINIIIRAGVIFILVTVLWSPIILKVYKYFIQKRFKQLRSQ